MKKILLSASLVALISFTSCKKEVNNEENTNITTDTVQVETPETAPESSEEAIESVSVPTLSNPEAQKFIDEYGVFVKEQIEAAKSADPAKLQEIAAKSQEWTKKVQEFASKLSPEDQKLWVEYAQKVTEQITKTSVAQ